MTIPIDTATGLQSGQESHTGATEVLVGYWVTHHDGSAAFIRGDRTRAENYLITHRGVRIEPVYVRRSGG